MEREAPSSVVSRRRLFQGLAGAALVVSSTMHAGGAQGEPTLIEPLKLNAVRIEAAWASGNAQYGFGIIVGERASTQLYIATANHVVRDRDRGRSTAVKVWLRGEGAATSAELLDDSSQVLDLAVLRVAKPQGFSWKTDVLGSADEQKTRGTAVWFIGRDRDWFTPVTPGRLALITFESKMQLEGLQVRVGSSGAPLVASTGIIGMLISDEGDTSYGIPIEKIQQAFGQWNFPFTLTPPAATTATPPQSRPTSRRGDTGDRGQAINDRVMEFPSVPVVASRGWQPTGVQVAKGDAIRIAYVSGSWRANRGVESRNPFELPPPRPRGGPPATRCDIVPPPAPFGGLVGRIGDEGQPFLASTPDISGEGMLFLRINACDEYLSSSEGTVVVRVQRARPPA